MTNRHANISEFCKKGMILFYAVYAVKCVWLAFVSPDYSPVYYYIMQIPLILCIPFGILTVLHRTYRNKIFSKNIWLCFLPFIYFFYSICNYYEKPDILYEFFTLVVILTFVLASPVIKSRVFELFYWIIQVCNIISIVFFLLYCFHINVGFQTVPYYSGSAYQSYIKWFIFAIYRSGLETRLCGIFNEPGALGTVCALLLIARYRYNKRWENASLVITTLLTFSLAGYILLFAYAAFYVVRKNRFNVIFLAIFIEIFLMIPNIDFGNEYLNMYAQRFRITSTSLAGDNRTNIYFDHLYEKFMDSKDVLFGWGKGYPKGEGGLSSYKTYVLEYGIVGFVFWIIIWVLSAFKISKRDKDCWLFITFFLLSLYQRPYLLQSIYGYVLLFGGLEWIKFMSNGLPQIYKKLMLKKPRNKTMLIALPNEVKV